MGRPRQAPLPGISGGKGLPQLAGKKGPPEGRPFSRRGTRAPPGRLLTMDAPTRYDPSVPELPLITSEDFDALAPEWAELWANVPGAPPFLHPDWHRVWLRHFGSGASPVFLSIRRDERLIGAAALDMEREEARELGDHNVRDYAGPLALPGEETPIAAGILEWLREDLTPAGTFWGLPPDDPRDPQQEQGRLGLRHPLQVLGHRLHLRGRARLGPDRERGHYPVAHRR